MDTEKFVFYAHGTDYNAEPEESNIVVGYFTSLVLVKAAVEEYVKENYEIEPEKLYWNEHSDKDSFAPYLVLTAADDDKEENFNIYIEAFPLDKRL
jgi:hypothetical protein